MLNLLRDKFTQHSTLKKITENIGWLFFDRFFRMGVGLFIGVWVARYLGPESFGLLNYVRALIALLGPIALLGLPSIVLRELVNTPKKSDEILGTAFCLHLLGGSVSWLILLLLVAQQRPGETKVFLVALILGGASIFRCTNVVRQVFEAKVQSKYVVWLENGIVPLIALAKITLIMCEASLLAFAGVMTLEACLVGTGLLLLYRKKEGSFFHWRAKKERASSLLQDSWPIIVGGVAMVIYISIDKIMLGKMEGDASVGIYSAATTISGMVYFLATVITSSVYPSLANAWKVSPGLYQRRLQNLLNLMVFMAVGVSLPMTLMSGWIIQILFGEDYSTAGPVLSIHIWACVFVFIDYAGNRDILLRNLMRKAIVFTWLGAITNVGLNIILIPQYSITGSAVATLISYGVSAYVSNIIFKDTRNLFYSKTKALLGYGFYSYFIKNNENKN